MGGTGESETSLCPEANNNSRHHHHNLVTSSIQVSADVGGSVLGSFTSIISLSVHSNDKVGPILNPLYI